MTPRDGIGRGGAGVSVLQGIELAGNAYYREDDLIERLGVSRAWLRRRCGGGLKAGRGRVYRGAAVLAAMSPCAGTPSPSQSTPAPLSGGPRPTSKAKADASSDGQPASASTERPVRESLVAWLRRERKQKQSVEPLASRPQHPTKAQRSKP
jgi:hypothetical protein